MKWLENIALLLLICFISGCVATGGKSVKPYGQLVKSWEQRSTTALSMIVEDARNNAETWVLSPFLYPQHLFDFSELKDYSIHYSAQGIESNRKSTIIVVRDGFWDDSVRGDIHELVIEKAQDQWEITSVKRAFRCWRNVDSASYSADACP